MKLRDGVALAAGVAVRPFGFEVRETILSEKPEGFPGYLDAASARGMDVNDYEEQVLRWYPAQAILEQTLFRHVRSSSIVCEVGPGTGRFSRLVANRLDSGALHLVDHSPWMVRFLTRYFRDQPQVHVHLGDGHSVPLASAAVDVVFVAGTIIALKLGTIDLYARDFARVLRPGGRVIFDYLDPTTPAGWEHLRTEGHRLADVYAYHAPDVIDRIFSDAGFEQFERLQIAKSTYFTACRDGA